MSETQETRQHIKNPELSTVIPEIKLFTAVHLISQNDKESAYNRIKNGDIDPKFWPPSITQDLRKNPNYTNVIAIDSLAPGIGTDSDAKMHVWNMVPRPGDYNLHGKVTVVLGDINYYRTQIDTAIRKNVKDEASDKFLESLNSQANPDAVGEYQIPSYASIAVESSFLIGLIASAWMAEEQLAKRFIKEDSIRNHKTLSRRRLLQFGAVAGGLFAVAAPSTKVLNSVLPQKRIELKSTDSKIDILKKALTGKFVDNNDVLDLRTALLIKKAETAAKMQGFPHASVIAGNAHLHNETQLRTDPAAQNKAIRAGSLKFGKMLEEASTFAGIAKETKQEIWNTFLDYLASMQIATITDPGVKQIPASQVEDIVGKAVNIDKEIFLNQDILKTLEPIRKLPLLQDQD